MVKENLVGKRFGRWIVLEDRGIRNRRHYYLCRCSCGSGIEKEIRSDILKSGNSQSCGCYHSEVMRTLDHESFKIVKHGLYGTRLNIIWHKMRQRCLNSNHTAYCNYGGRGIKICDDWLDKKDGFISFYNWAINNGYDDNLTLDRIDTNGNYCPENCRWATIKEQNNNTRSNHRVNVFGDTYTISELADILEESYTNIWHRLARRNYDAEKLLRDDRRLRDKFETNRNTK